MSVVLTIKRETDTVRPAAPCKPVSSGGAQYRACVVAVVAVAGLLNQQGAARMHASVA